MANGLPLGSKRAQHLGGHVQSIFRWPTRLTPSSTKSRVKGGAACRVHAYLLQNMVGCSCKAFLLQRSHRGDHPTAWSGDSITFNQATFSTVPTSPGCVCFAIQSSKDSDLVFISTCSPGDTQRNTIVLNGFNKSIEEVVYSKRTFFCAFKMVFYWEPSSLGTRTGSCWYGTNWEDVAQV